MRIKSHADSSNSKKPSMELTIHAFSLPHLILLTFPRIGEFYFQFPNFNISTHFASANFEPRSNGFYLKPLRQVVVQRIENASRTLLKLKPF